MDGPTREVAEKGRNLQKAISSSEPSANVLAILQDLKSNVKPTEKLLRESHIGRIVNKIKGVQNLDPQVQQLASEIISRWRHVINEQKAASPGNLTPNGARSNGTSSPAPKSAPAVQPKAASPGVAPDKRSWKTDKVPKDELTKEPGRNNCIGLLYDGLAAGSTRPMRELLSVAKDIESACLSLPGAGGTSGSTVYKEKIRSLFQNLKNKSNPGLREKVAAGKITPQQLATMSADEMKSKEMKAEDAAIQKENLNNAMVPKEEKSVSESLECGKCKQKKVSYSKCLNCEKCCTLLTMLQLKHKREVLTNQ